MTSKNASPRSYEELLHRQKTLERNLNTHVKIICGLIVTAVVWIIVFFCFIFGPNGTDELEKRVDRLASTVSNINDTEQADISRQDVVNGLYGYLGLEAAGYMFDDCGNRVIRVQKKKTKESATEKYFRLYNIDMNCCVPSK